MRKIYLLALLLVASFSLQAQKRGQARIDSLLSQLPAMAEDTGKVKLMIDLSNVYADINPAEGIRYGESARELSDKKQYTRGLMNAYNAIGVNYKIRGDFEKSIGYHNKAYTIAEQLADKKTMAGSLGSIGSNYLYQGAYPKALENYLKALKLNEETGNKNGMGSVIGNIGNVYSYLKEYDKSLSYYERAIRIYGELGNKAGVAAYTGNAGYIYLYQNNFPKAIEYISKALQVNEALGNLNAIAGNSQGMGRVYQTQHNYVKAITYYEKALQVAEKVGNKIAIAQNLLTMGEVYLQAAKDTMPSPFTGDLSTRKGLLTQVLVNANRAITLRKEAKDVNGLNFAYDTKSEVELELGDAVAALASYKEHITYRDSVFNLEKTKEINRRELQYEFGKREDSLKYQQLVTSQQLMQQQLLSKQQ
jgi:tetratricopeptide (TPR) repeat protein